MSRLSAIREALAQSPDNISLLLLLARESLDDMQAEEAREAYEQVLSVDPEQIDAQIGIARLLMLDGDLSAAAVRAERVLQKDPQCPQAHLLLSRICLNEGDRSRAMLHYERATATDSTISDPALEREFRKPGRKPRPPAADLPAADPLPELFPFDDADGEMIDDFGMDWRPETFYAPGDPARSQVTFADIGGMDELKEEIRLKIIYPLQHPDLYKAYGRRTGGGILLCGPPGCGKTLMLRAVAGEAPCNYLAVGLHEIFDPYYGSSERNLHQVFETARAQSPCVLVFDEVDSLALDRRNVRESQIRNLVNQFLHELDGLRGENQRVLVIGSTNQPWQLDAAFRRPGRFDQSIFVPPPDAAAREQIVELLARGKPVAQLDLPQLAKATADFSGADLKWLFDRAAELALSDAIHAGRPLPITMELLLQVAARHSPSTRDWFEGLSKQAPAGGQDALYLEARKFLPAAKKR